MIVVASQETGSFLNWSLLAVHHHILGFIPYNANNIELLIDGYEPGT